MYMNWIQHLSISHFPILSISFSFSIKHRIEYEMEHTDFCRIPKNLIFFFAHAFHISVHMCSFVNVYICVYRCCVCAREKRRINVRPAISKTLCCVTIVTIRFWTDRQRHTYNILYILYTHPTNYPIGIGTNEQKGRTKKIYIYSTV